MVQEIGFMRITTMLLAAAAASCIFKYIVNKQCSYKLQTPHTDFYTLKQ